MSHIEAVYSGGVFKPLGQVDLEENQRVRLSVEPLGEKDVRAWLAETQSLKQKLAERHGVFPDSTPEIAADRLR